MNSGASEASGASHCTSRNWSSPSASPLPIRASANGSAQARMTSADPANIATTSGRRCAGRQGADPRGGSHQVVLVAAVVPGHPDQVVREQPEQHDRQQQRDLTGQRHREREHPGNQEEAELEPVALRQQQHPHRLAAGPTGDEQRDQDHGRPAQPEQQPVRAGHVGRGVLHVLGSLPGLVGEVEVHRVLRQHHDHGQDGHRQAAGDVDLRSLRRPGQHERRGHHAEPEDQQRRRGQAARRRSAAGSPRAPIRSSASSTGRTARSMSPSFQTLR